jgi:hypothetical protein
MDIDRSSTALYFRSAIHYALASVVLALYGGRV